MKGKEQEKNVRTSKVQYSSRPFHKRNGLLHTSGYTYFPRISIAGLWLEELGFHVVLLLFFPDLQLLWLPVTELADIMT